MFIWELCFGLFNISWLFPKHTPSIPDRAQKKSLGFAKQDWFLKSIPIKQNTRVHPQLFESGVPYGPFLTSCLHSTPNPQSLAPSTFLNSSGLHPGTKLPTHGSSHKRLQEICFTRLVLTELPAVQYIAAVCEVNDGKRQVCDFICSDRLLTRYTRYHLLVT